MAITTKTQSDLVAGQVTAMQAANAGLLDFGTGSLLLAIVQAVAEVALWLQAIVLQLVATTRAATSTGSDLDSWVGDFGVTRLASTFATGSVLFSRFSTGAQVVVPLGSTVETSDGTQAFTVSLDTTNAAYSAALGGYVMAAGVASVTVPVQAQVAGSAANVAAGTITTITGAIPGVDTVTNSSPVTNGADAETDAALRLRFVAFVSSRSEATPAAVEYAIESVQQGLTYELVENYAYTGVYQPGYFYAVVDDGTGTPPATLLAAVTAAIQAVRPLTSQFAVFAPVLVPINIAMTITGGSATTVQAALALYVADAELNGDIEYTKLSQVAYNADPNVTNVTGVTLNGGTADIVCTQQQRPMVGAITVA